MAESRMDRIERYLAEFIHGMKEERAAIAELRESGVIKSVIAHFI